MKKNTMLAILLAVSSLIICANSYCDDSLAQTSQERTNDAYADSVPALSVNDATDRQNTAEGVIANKNALNVAAQTISGLNLGSSTNLEPTHITGDLVLYEPLTISEGQTLIVDGSLTLNSGIIGTMVGAYDPSNYYSGGAISLSSYTVFTSFTSPWDGTIRSTEPLPSLANEPSTTVAVGSPGNGAIISSASTQYLNVSGSGAIANAALDATVTQVKINDTANNPKIDRKEDKERQSSFVRERLEMQRQGLKDMLNGPGNRIGDKKKKEYLD